MESWFNTWWIFWSIHVWSDYPKLPLSLSKIRRSSTISIIWWLFDRTPISYVEEVRELILYHLVTISNKWTFIFLCLNPMNMMLSSIWTLGAQTDMSYFEILVSLLIEATIKQTNGGDVDPTSTRKFRVILEVWYNLKRANWSGVFPKT